jgi:hypothetical protein
MAGLVPAIRRGTFHAGKLFGNFDAVTVVPSRDGRDKPGHDAGAGRANCQFR